jgi:hypothetical protein
MPLVPRPQSRIGIIDSVGNASNYFTRFLTAVSDAINGTHGIVGTGVNQVTLGIGSNVSSGTGSPNSVVIGNPGDLYLNLAGGANQTFWVKESGSATNTGWVGK